MSKYRTPFDSAKVIPSDPGERIKIDYILAYDDDDREYLKEVGRHNLNDEIDSYRDSCDISLLINKIKNGEISTIIDPSACFDCSELPKDITECFETIKSDIYDVVPDTPDIGDVDDTGNDTESELVPSVPDSNNDVDANSVGDE